MVVIMLMYLLIDVPPRVPKAFYIESLYGFVPEADIPVSARHASLPVYSKSSVKSVFEYGPSLSYNTKLTKCKNARTHLCHLQLFFSVLHTEYCLLTVLILHRIALPTSAFHYLHASTHSLFPFSSLEYYHILDIVTFLFVFAQLIYRCALFKY